jgi:tetraacyldisaccharide 4'-kinase
VTGAQSAAGSFRREQVRAFCGLGNPHGFRLTLEEIVPGVEITEFPDHHRYSAAEITRLVTPGTVALLTTEKDVINLPDGWAAKCPVPILWLLVDIELDEPEKFRTLLLDRCS